MINFNIELQNPWAKENFKNLFFRFWKLSKHKGAEFEIIRYAESFLTVNFKWSTRTDHAGVSLELALFGYQMSVSVYDIRHWDYGTNAWKIYNKEDEICDIENKNR